MYFHKKLISLCFYTGAFTDSSVSHAFQEGLYKSRFVHILFLLGGRMKGFVFFLNPPLCKTKDATTFWGR